jgi:hypothetical protein
VGWYRDARVFRDRITFSKPPSAQHRLEKFKDNYRIRARAENTLIIPHKQRDIGLGRGKGWIGQANWWFPEKQSNGAIRRFVEKLRARIETGSEVHGAGNGGGGGKWGGQSDPLRNAEVEKAAILKVREHFAGYRIESVEKDNVGWDLQASPKGAGTALRLEVKGLFGQDLKVGLTPREYRALQKHIEGSMPNYRLCVVTGALSSTAKLVVFRFDADKQRWIDERSSRVVAPGISVVQAAIVSLG